MVKDVIKNPNVDKVFRYHGRASDFDLMGWLNDVGSSAHVRIRDGMPIIKTPKGDAPVNPGDYIICGAQGELHLRKTNIFNDEENER